MTWSSRTGFSQRKAELVSFPIIKMIYKPEPVVDLETGAVVQAEVQPGDHSDLQAK